MARKLFEKQAIRRRTGALANGVVLQVYTDEAGTVLADVSATLGGSAIAGSLVTTADIDGLGPASLRFWGPPDGTDVLYMRVPSDASLRVQKIEADPDPRLDALEAGSASGIPGSVVDAKGDLLAATAADTVTRLAVGANDLVLTPDSSTATGLKWAMPVGAPIDPEAAPYLADGTGGTDSFAALSAAVTAAQTLKRPLVAKPGKTFRVDTLLTVSAATVIDLQGSTIKKGAALANVAIYVTGDDVVLRNVKVDGNRAAGATGGGIRWDGDRGKAFDCESSHNKSIGWDIRGTLDAWRCAGNDNVGGAANADGFIIWNGGVLRTADCVADDNDRSGFFFLGGDDGSRLDGSAARNGRTGATISGANYGSVGDFLAEDCNGFGVTFEGHPTGWQVDTIRTRNIGIALAGLGLAENGAGTGVEAYGLSDSSFGMIENIGMRGYGLAFTHDTAATAFKSVRNHVGTVTIHHVGVGDADPAVHFSEGAAHNSIGTIIANGTTMALIFGEDGTLGANFNTVGEVHAHDISYLPVKINIGIHNHIGRVVARNVGNADTGGVGQGIVDFQSAAVTGNTVGWIDYAHDPAVDANLPTCAVHADASATGNHVFGGELRGLRALIDVNGGNSYGTKLLPSALLLGSTTYREPYLRHQGGANIAVLTSGVMCLVAVPLFSGDYVASIAFLAGSTGLTMGSDVNGHLWFALYNPALTLMAQTADQGGADTWTAGAVKDLALASPQTIPTDGVYFAAVMVNAGTGGSPAVPSLRGMSLQTTAISGGSASGWPGAMKQLAASNGSALVATAPAGPITLTTISNAPYCVLH